MIRIIVRAVDYECLAYTGEGKATCEFKTFDIDAPALEEFMREKLSRGFTREIIGAELP